MSKSKGRVWSATVLRAFIYIARGVTWENGFYWAHGADHDEKIGYRYIGILKGKGLIQQNGINLELTEEGKVAWQEVTARE